MTATHSLKIVTENLVLCMDTLNIRSYRGIEGYNLLNTITAQANTANSTWVSASGTEIVDIPELGPIQTYYVNHYNDYPNSAVCCPAPFSYTPWSNTNIVVSPSTVFTYEIVYKTQTGYTHPNFMYRYEYANSNVYVTEGGVHDDNNRRHLGDGWYHAWGQFTTNANTTNIPYCAFFYYNWGVWDKISVAKAMLIQDPVIVPVNQMIDFRTTRGANNSTGGGWIDLTNSANYGEFVNDPYLSTTSNNALVFDGTNYVKIPENAALNSSNVTVEVWARPNNLNQNGFFFEKGQVNTQYSLFLQGGNIVWRHNNNTYGLIDMTNYASLLSNTQSNHIVGTYTSGARCLYVNGVQVNTDTLTGTINTNANGSSIGVYGGFNGGRGYYYDGDISVVRVYAKALSQGEVVQNFNAAKTRFGR